jgi:S-adenosylmethionine synthetase
VSYAIGVAEPLAVYVDTFGSNVIKESEMLKLIGANFDLRPGVIVQQLGLFEPMFERTACYGHFGWSEYPWERPMMIKLD